MVAPKTIYHIDLIYYIDLHRTYLIKKMTRGRGSKIADFETTQFVDGPLSTIDISKN